MLPARSLREQLERLRSFQRLYNEERPHQALGNARPSITRSRRGASTAPCEPDYSADHEVTYVRHNGEIRWLGDTIYISEALIGEPVGLSKTRTGARPSATAGKARHWERHRIGQAQDGGCRSRAEGRCSEGDRRCEGGCEECDEQNRRRNKQEPLNFRAELVGSRGTGPVSRL
jgi:hypothetical protein